MGFTEKQKRAVELRNKDILISAAAGSGKTTVLASRVESLISEGADIRKMLICTYTRMAAGELRGRIYSRLCDAAAKNSDPRLMRQAELTGSAMIGTIHSFCTQVISDNFLQAGLKADWKTAAGALSKKLKEEALNRALFSLYDEENEDIIWLSERYGKRDDKPLMEAAIGIYELSRSLPEGIEWLLEEKRTEKLYACADEYIKERLNIMEETSYGCKALVTKYEELSALYSGCEKLCESIKNLKRTYNEKGIRELYVLLKEFKVLPRRGAKSKELSAVYGEYTDIIKTKCVPELIELSELLCNEDKDALLKEKEYIKRLSGAMYVYLKRFCEIYTALKEQRGVLDFDDLIHTAYRLLLDDEIAEVYKNKYDYVFVDEYQDTNSIQDALIERVCKKGSRFIVGDVKQSIYSFRLADPQVFKEKAGKIKENGGEVVYMNDNFRSAPEILSEVNRVMGKLMTKELGGVDYTGGEVLNAKREDLKGNVRYITAVKDGSLPAAVSEAKVIAEEIKRLVKEENFSYGDFAVLLRKKKRGNVICEELRRAGIPANFQDNVSEPPETELFISYIKLIDSEADEIPLISVMRSFCEGFTEEDLAEIRANNKGVSFMEALKSYDKEPLKGRIERFFVKIDRLRLLAGALPADEFLIRLKEETGLYKLLPALPGGEERAQMFSRFFDTALSYASGSSLSELLKTLLRLKEETGFYCETGGELPDGAVKIMTIHASKGLQFPVVFLSELDNMLNRSDSNETILKSAAYGVASDIFDVQELTRKKSVCGVLLKDILRKNALSEELRVLYVAMTRAEKKLIFTSERAEGAKTKYVCPRYALSYEKIIMPFFEEINEYRRVSPQPLSERLPLNDVVLQEKGEEEFNIIIPDVKKVPVKMGVSSLLDDYDVKKQGSVFEKKYDEEQTSGADFGTLIHGFLQHYDYKEKRSVSQTARLLLEGGFLTKEECERVMSFSEKLERFLSSNTAKRIARSPEIYKELPFCLAVKAQEMGYDSEDIVVIQGIMDVVIKEDDGYVIIDYKTNTKGTTEELCDHYKKQMDYYRRALEKIKKCRVKECVLCFLARGEEVSLK